MCAQPAASPSDPTARLFERISRIGRVDALAEVEGRLRFDLAVADRVEQWTIVVQYGQIAVTRDGGEADCVVELDKEVLDEMATGHANAMAALLRGDITVRGEVRLLVLLERLLPGPAGARGPRRTVRSQGAG